MMITRETIRDHLVAYLNHKTTLADLVDWAENMKNDGILDPQDASMLRNIIARLGVADVKNFGLAWDDCYDFLSRLGYHVQVLAA